MSEPQHTLFLWLRGAFPRRIAYQLLHKGIVASPSDMLAGRTVLLDFTINIASITLSSDGTPSMTDADPSDPKPQGKSSPCLRIRQDGSERWINESTAIALYIEDAFPDFRAAVGKDVVSRAQALDMLTLTNLLGHDFGYYLRHAAPVTEFWSGLANADRSHAAARNALAGMVKGLAKLQDWAVLDETGWMTPGVEGPGVVDFGLAGNMRYLELAYEFDVFEDERLGKLREWKGRFKGLGWWEELEEVGDVHPSALRYPKDIREV